MEKNLTTGSVFKNLLFFSLPYLLSYFLQTLYGMADLFIIGQFEGVSSTTAISIGSQVMHMLTVMIVGLAMGSTVLIGQAVGAGDKKKSASAIGNTTVLFLGLGYPIATMGPSVWSNDLAAPEQYPTVVRRLQVIYAGGALAFSSLPGILADHLGGYLPAYLLFTTINVLSLVCIALSYRAGKTARQPRS